MGSTAACGDGEGVRAGGVREESGCLLLRRGARVGALLPFIHPSNEQHSIVSHQLLPHTLCSAGRCQPGRIILHETPSMQQPPTAAPSSRAGRRRQPSCHHGPRQGPGRGVSHLRGPAAARRLAIHAGAQPAPPRPPLALAPCILPQALPLALRIPLFSAARLWPLSPKDIETTVDGLSLYPPTIRTSVGPVQQHSAVPLSSEDPLEALVRCVLAHTASACACMRAP